jgi:polysaccharide deacetylase family protein (PEP-CTERM system associated)
VKATFFVLGWIADHYPWRVQEIARKGHEIGVHGYYHRRVDAQDPDSFKAEISRTITKLRDLGIQDVIGHRAPSFSITPDSLWAWDVLKECGLSYDASLSVKHFPMGTPPWVKPHPGPQDCRTIAGETIRVFPQAFLPAWPKLPFAGGGYFRLYPYWVTRRGIAAWNRQGVPITVYVHPWEFDPDQPRLGEVSRLRRFKHYVNLETNREKFARLLQDFSFRSCRDCLR